MRRIAIGLMNLGMIALVGCPADNPPVPPPNPNPPVMEQPDDEPATTDPAATDDATGTTTPPAQN